MTLSEYKEKGILEAYVLGVLDPEASEKLLSDLKTNVALRRELNQVEQGLASFKENFTRSQSDKSKIDKNKTIKRSSSKSDKNLRMILGVLTLVMVVMIFLFLSTIYENNNYRTSLSMQLEKVDSLKTEITKKVDLISAQKKGIISLSSGTADLIEFNSSGNPEFSTAYLLVPEDRTAPEFLIIEGKVSTDGDYFLQLWSRVDEQFRRVGRVQAPLNGDDWIVHTLPRTNLQLTHISLESDPPLSRPSEENLIFSLN